jgi:hypothetical protein
MRSFSARRTKRKLFKLASLGLAGLLAGLLTGCTDTLSISSTTPPSTPYSDLFRSTPLPESLDATQIPALHHPPSSRRLQFGSLHTVSQSMAPNGRNRS